LSFGDSGMGVAGRFVAGISGINLRADA
jgi:hypothetical protein